MFAKILPIFVLFVATHQATVPEAENHLAGIDPNTLSCDPLGKIHLLLPHFYDCSKFYKCAHGEEVEFECAPFGLFFDFELQTCNWPWATKCWLRDAPEVEGSGEEEYNWLSGKDSADAPSLIGPAPPNSVRSMEVQPQKFNSNIVLNCLRADSAVRMEPYKGDCQRYWRCEDGVPKTAYCSDGLFFNEKTQQCDFEANVLCEVQQEDELKTEFISYTK
ncbi:uncharacterized protein [Epargyreus clarus]|uniref:uncharacterized protein n=1 Tax=Epargyreus clarus TaxID=520877 RepID=UPI003C2DC63D